MTCLFLLVLLITSCTSNNFMKNNIIEDNSSIYYGRYEKIHFILINRNHSIEDLSVKYQVPIKELRRLNITEDNEIKTGKILRIPYSKYHMISPGDTIENLAYTYEVDVKQLLKMNNIQYNDILTKDNYLKIPKNSFNYFKHLNNEYIFLNKKEINNLHKQQKKKYFTNQYPLGDSNLIWPTHGEIIKRYGWHNGIKNEGINIKAKKGTSVKLCDKGEIIFVGKNLKKHGNIIICKHNNGLLSAYAHLDKIFIKKGDLVNKGATISTVGNSGDVKVAQLKLSFRKGNYTVNPEKHLK